MKRWILLILLIVGLSAAGTVAVQLIPETGGKADLPLLAGAGKGSESAGKKPKVSIDKDTTYDFGTLPQRVTGKQVWVVKNEGDADLEMWQESATCSCTVAKFKDGQKGVLKPGESTEIALEFETRENNGEYKKGATIGTNDPEMPQFSLWASGKVFPAVMTVPSDPNISFSTISNDDGEAQAKIAVYSADRPELKITGVKSSNPAIDATSEPLTKEELAGIGAPLKMEKGLGGQKVVIHVKPGLPLGVFREELILTTDHPKQAEVRLVVSGKMIGPINPQPGAVVMHDIYSKAGGTGQVMLVVRNQRPTTFEVVKKPEKLQVEVLPAENGGKPGRYQLKVSVPPGTPPQRFEEELVLKSDHPKAERVIVPISVWVLNSN